MKMPPETDSSAPRISYGLWAEAAAVIFPNGARKNGIPLQNNQVDIGVRVELPSILWEDFFEKNLRAEKYGIVPNSMAM